jgi:hypothetical protein
VALNALRTLKLALASAVLMAVVFELSVFAWFGAAIKHNLPFLNDSYSACCNDHLIETGFRHHFEISPYNGNASLF